MSKRNVFRAVIYILIAINIAFIWSMSMYSKEESGDQSSTVAEILLSVFTVLRKIPDEIFEKLVRKLAHFSEFAMLGVLSASALWEHTDRKKLSFSSLAFVTLLMCFSIASTDETIQLFTNRGCQVKDILLDFSGALFGFSIISVVRAMLLQFKKSNSN